MFLAAGRGDFVLGSLAGIEGTVRKKRAYDEVLEITRVTDLPWIECASTVAIVVGRNDLDRFLRPICQPVSVLHRTMVFGVFYR